MKIENNKMSSNYLEIDKKKLMRYSYKIEKYLKGDIPIPITLEIQPTERCNCNCPHCQSRNYFSYDIRQNKIKQGVDLDLKLLDRILRTPPNNVIISGTTGEPLLHPHINLLFTMLKSSKIPITLITNGLCIDNVLAKNIIDGCTTVRVSLDAVDDISYSRTHGIEKSFWYKVIGNIKLLIKEKKRSGNKCRIGIGYLTNIDSCEIEKAVLLARELGGDFIDFRPFQEDRGHPVDSTMLKHIFDSKKYETDEFRINSSHQKYHTINSIQRTYDFCYCSYFYTLLDPNGDLYLCCNHVGDKSANYGSLKDVTDWTICLKSQIKRNKAANVKNCPLGCRLHTYNIVLDEFVKNTDHCDLACAEFTLCNAEATAWESI